MSETNSVNKPAFVSELPENVQAAGFLADNVANEDLSGNVAVKDPTAGSYEAIVAGNAAAVGFWRFLEADTGLEVLLITARRA